MAEIRSKVRSSTNEDLELDAQKMTIFEDGDCWLVALDDWEISLILSSLRYAHWQKRWLNLGGHTWDEIEEAICNLEYCLMAGCNVGELLNKFDDLNGYMSTLVGRFISGETNITQAVENLELVANCAPDVNLSCPPPVVNVQCGSGGVTGITPEEQSGEEGGTPPAGTKEPSEIDDRKCKAANLIYDKVHSMIQELGLQDVDTLAGIGLVGSTSLLFAVIGLAGGPFGAIIGAVGGAVLGIVMAIIAGGLDFNDIITVMENNQSDLVCSLYNATTAQQAREDFISILSDGGLSAAEIALIEFLLPNDATNCLFFTQDSANGDALEAELDGYEVSIECWECVGGNCFGTVQYGTGEPWGLIESQWIPAAGAYGVRVCYDHWHDFTIALSGWTATGYKDFHFWSETTCTGGYWPPDVYWDYDPPTYPISGSAYFLIYSSTPFTATVSAPDCGG